MFFLKLDILSELLILYVLLTNDEEALDTILTFLVKYSFFTVLIFDTFIHFITNFLQIFRKTKKKIIETSIN